MTVTASPERGHDERILGSAPKNSRERIVVERHSFRGHDLVGIRVQWRASDDDDWKWSQKGLTVSVDRMPDLMDLLLQAMRTISVTWVPTTETEGRKTA